MKNVVIIGTGGHAKVVADIVQRSGDCVLGFLTKQTGAMEFLGKPILGLDTEYSKIKDAYFIVAIGNATVREKLVNAMPEAKWYTAIHPTAVISAENTTIGEGTVISANAVVNACAKIGRHCIINTHATVEHDNVIQDFSHISVGTMLAGEVTVGKSTWVGIGATVKNGISICERCMVGAGAVVVKDIEAEGTYVGVPAKRRE